MKILTGFAMMLAPVFAQESPQMVKQIEMLRQTRS